MDIDVYDTYARTAEGKVLHFDILLPCGEDASAMQYANDWLQCIGIPQGTVRLDKCNYCHTENATADVVQHILQYGYFIIQMEGCPGTTY